LERHVDGPRGLAVRPAQPRDVETLHRFVLELAEAESFPGEVEAKPVQHDVSFATA